jgi:hypothetical protein
VEIVMAVPKKKVYCGYYREDMPVLADAASAEK